MRTVRRGFSGDAPARAAFGALMQEVFGRGIDAAAGDPSLSPFAIFDAGGACLAGLEVIELSLVLDGTRSRAAGIGSVAVAPAWRGRGLFRALMEEALAWCSGPVLLYTEEPALYSRFGFRSLPQHRFTGPPPVPVEAGAPARWLSLESDGPLIGRLLATRTPVSNHVALEGGSALFLRQLATADGFALDYLPDQDALIVWNEDEDGGFTLANVVAPRIPPLAAILAALGRRPEQIGVLFPPDKLEWTGTPVPDETGLRISGEAPAAFSRPFMLPPTAEF
jgi:GNAT superfamily N-acetyltransferase